MSVLPCGYQDAGENKGLLSAGKQLFEHEALMVASSVAALGSATQSEICQQL